MALPFLLVAANSVKEIQHWILVVGGIPGRRVDQNVALVADRLRVIPHHLHLSVRDAVAGGVKSFRFGRKRPLVVRAEFNRSTESSGPTPSAATPTASVDAAHAKVGPDTIAKFLFTSGSTGMPKGVLHSDNTLLASGRRIGFGARADNRRAGSRGRRSASGAGDEPVAARSAGVLGDGSGAVLASPGRRVIPSVPRVRPPVPRRRRAGG